jgi:hypothetical protein
VDGDQPLTWAERRRYAIDQHAAADRARRAVEVAQARRLVAEFASDATELGLALTPLFAGSFGGRGRYRTRLHGWYIHPNLSLAVGPDGAFYRLVVAGTLRALLLGVVIEPEDPPLVVGAGARDGESIGLRALLRRRLEAADEWP